VEYDPGVRDDDEIDLYEILDVILRRKWTIIITTLLCSILGFGAALYYSKVLKPEKYAMDFTINYGIFNPEMQSELMIPVFSVTTILNRDTVVEEFFKIEDLQKEFAASKADLSAGETEAWRDFLREILEIKPLLDKQDETTLNLKRYTASTTLKKDSKLHSELLNKFWDILNESIIIETDRKLQQIEALTKKQMESSLSTLDALGKKFDAILKENLNFGENDLDLQLLIKFPDTQLLIKYMDPAAYSRNEEEIKLYAYYNGLDKKIVTLRDRIDNGELLYRNTSIYKVKVSGKGKIILGVGIIAGICFGLFLAFTKEFWSSYQRRKQAETGGT
jgi:hypothetical protein